MATRMTPEQFRQLKTALSQPQFGTFSQVFAFIPNFSGLSQEEALEQLLKYTPSNELGVKVVSVLLRWAQTPLLLLPPLKKSANGFLLQALDAQWSRAIVEGGMDTSEVKMPPGLRYEIPNTVRLIRQQRLNKSLPPTQGAGSA